MEVIGGILLSPGKLSDWDDHIFRSKGIKYFLSKRIDAFLGEFYSIDYDSICHYHDHVLRMMVVTFKCTSIIKSHYEECFDYFIEHL